MPTNNAFRPKKVEPKTRKKAKMKNDKLMLMLESHLIPFPTPESADSVEAIITMINANSIAATVGDPSASIIHVAPVILNMPDANCETPYPIVTDTPRIVAITETMSMM